MHYVGFCAISPEGAVGGGDLLMLFLAANLRSTSDLEFSHWPFFSFTRKYCSSSSWKMKWSSVAVATGCFFLLVELISGRIIHTDVGCGKTTKKTLRETSTDEEISIM
jgi:hypothetical protein